MRYTSIGCPLYKLVLTSREENFPTRFLIIVFYYYLFIICLLFVYYYFFNLLDKLCIQYYNQFVLFN